MTKQIGVNLGKESYCIHIGNGFLRNLTMVLDRKLLSGRIAIVSTPTIFKMYGKYLSSSLKKINPDHFFILVPDGEKEKNEKNLFRILTKLTQHEFQRDGCLISMGGGVVGDLGGLAASLYMRGINFIQVPTTLLAQVDASVGGKTAIDFLGIKNLVGTFYQPKSVFIDTVFLKTLNDRQFRTGLAEVIKYGIIFDEKMFNYIEKNLPLILQRADNPLTYLIYKSCQAKAKIVSEDEKENGKRKWLNYGHTLGHALESYFQYHHLTHGEAIAYGMWFAAILSSKLGLCKKETLKRQNELLLRAGLFKKLPFFRPEKVYEKMFLDKKARKGQIQFVLTRKIGLVTIQKNIPQSTILSALIQLQSEARELC